MDVVKMVTGVRGVTKHARKRALRAMEALHMIVLNVHLTHIGIQDMDVNAIMVIVEVYAYLLRKLIAIQNVLEAVMVLRIPTATNVL